jgi:hypothetical protein
MRTRYGAATCSAGGRRLCEASDGDDQESAVNNAVIRTVRMTRAVPTSVPTAAKRTTPTATSSKASVMPIARLTLAPSAD